MTVLRTGGATARLETGDAHDLLRDIADESIDAIITSPPYDAIRTYGEAWSVDLPKMGHDVHRILKQGGMAAVVIGDGTQDGAKTGTTALLTAAWITETPLRLFETLIYSRHGRPGAWWSTRFRVDHEFILLFVKGKRRAYLDKEHLREPTKHAGRTARGTARHSDGTTRRLREGWVTADTKERGTIWHYATSNAEGNRVKAEHPATFPDALAADLVRAICPPGGVVLDPFVGSGTTLVQAMRHGRDGIGFDIDPAYVDIATRRLEREVPAILEGR
jgi:DNA modification methylase